MAIEARQDEFFDELETMSPAAREKYLNQKLSETVDNAYQHAPAVKEIFDRAGVSPDLIRTVKDLESCPSPERLTSLSYRRQILPTEGSSPSLLRMSNASSSHPAPSMSQSSMRV